MAKGQIKQKLTAETIRKLEYVFSIDGTVLEACYFAGISQDTFYRWVREFPELSEKFNILRQNPVLKARQAVVGALDNPEYAFKYLERKMKKEFSLRTELTGADGGSLKVDVTKLTDDELKKIIDETEQ